MAAARAFAEGLTIDALAAALGQPRRRHPALDVAQAIAMEDQSGIFPSLSDS